MVGLMKKMILYIKLNSTGGSERRRSGQGMFFIEMREKIVNNCTCNNL